MLRCCQNDISPGAGGPSPEAAQIALYEFYAYVFASIHKLHNFQLIALLIRAMPVYSRRTHPHNAAELLHHPKGWSHLFCESRGRWQGSPDSTQQKLNGPSRAA